MAGPPLTPEFKPGELVLGNIFHNLTAGKWRPVVLVHPDPKGWAVMGLTTSSRYNDGTARMPVPGWRDCGLTGPAWLWSYSLRTLTAMDLTGHIGWATPELAAAIVKAAPWLLLPQPHYRPPQPRVVITDDRKGRANSRLSGTGRDRMTKRSWRYRVNEMITLGIGDAMEALSEAEREPRDLTAKDKVIAGLILGSVILLFAAAGVVVWGAVHLEWLAVIMGLLLAGLTLGVLKVTRDYARAMGPPP